jgi:hypothetical protein
MAARAWNSEHPNKKLELWSQQLLDEVSAPAAPDEPQPEVPKSMASHAAVSACPAANPVTPLHFST